MVKTIASDLALVRNRIENAREKGVSSQQSIHLLAVSKKQPVEKIKIARQLGQCAFGESYVQEAVEKITLLSDYPEIIWHFIGPIQSNKTKLIAQHFDWVQSVDRLKLIERLNEQRPSDKPALNICLQVNLQQEDTKSGAGLSVLNTLAAAVDAAPHLSLRGLMCIPKRTQDVDEQRAVFASLRAHYEKLQQQFPTVDTLSMGMSADLEAAIAEGATMIRVGTAIFGERSQ